MDQFFDKLNVSPREKEIILLLLQGKTEPDEIKDDLLRLN